MQCCYGDLRYKLDDKNCFGYKQLYFVYFCSVFFLMVFYLAFFISCSNIYLISRFIYLKTNTLKRPSPEPICDPASSPNTTNNNKPIPVTKKPKVTKKKKKRDPNEPQK